MEIHTTRKPVEGEESFASLTKFAKGLKFKTVEYICPIHGKQVYEIPEFSRNAPRCPICAMAENEKRRRLDDAKAESRIRERELVSLLHPSVIEDNQLMTFDSYVPDCEKAKKAIAITRRFAENFTEREAERIELENVQSFAEARKKNSCGLFLYGNSGCGKTHLATSIVWELKCQGWGSLMLTASELIYGYQSIFRYEEKSRVMNLLTMIPVLVIDEIGRQKNKDKDSDFLWKLLNDRVRYGRPTILITNFTGEELKTIFDDSVFDRLRSSTFPLLFDWKSNRKTVARTTDPMQLF